MENSVKTSTASLKFIIALFAIFIVAVVAMSYNEEPHECNPVTPDFELQHYYNASFGTTVYKFMDGNRRLGTIQTERRFKTGETYTVIITKPE